MAAFTAALIGLALAGGLTAGKKLGAKQANDANAQAQTDTTLGGPGPKPPTAPPSLALTNAAATSQANAASSKQRKKALSAGTLTNGPTSTQTPATPKLQPRTLLGY